MSDDLVNGWPCDDRRRDSGCRQPYGCHCREITSLRSVIEAQAAENERLRIAAGDAREKYATSYFRAVESRTAWRARAEQAERALAEAVELIDQLSSFQISETLEKTGKLSDLCKAWIEHKKFARQFVKEHGRSSHREAT